MQTENSDEGGNGGIVVQASGEPDDLQVEAGEGQVLRVEVDGKVIRGKRVVVRAVPDTGPQLVKWDKLEAGCLYVDRFGDKRISGVLQVGSDGKAWRWAWTPYSSTGGWGELRWHEGAVLRGDAPEAELVGRSTSDEIADARAAFEAWATEHGEVLQPA